MSQRISISVGASRKETNWKNLELNWEQFIEKLKKPIVTNETYAEYIKAAKDKQLEIKDVGGFVGGTISGGRRLINSISARSLLTLDIDYAPAEFFTEFSLSFDCEALLHSTHKHGKDNVRYRLIIPLKREVLPDEYEAISRKLAGNLDIEWFDPTTFQPERLMYWPSISKDAVYYIERQKGKWLDPDQLLDSYADWRDTSEWPISVKATKGIKDRLAKQEDPVDKGGMVGVFCRCYGIEEAILKFLPHVYEQTDQEDRWTYKEGSTHGGMLVYDNKFSFSHHSTDPTQGRLCNAFDLVRLHLFGDSDDKISNDTPLNKKPSYTKMIEHLTQDSEVKKHVVLDRIEKKTGAAPTIENGDWVTGLEMDKKGNILNTINNIVTILNNDEKFKDNLCFDDLQKVPKLKKDLPWRKIDRFSSELRDSDDAEFRNYFEIMYGVNHKDKLKDGLEIVIHKNTFHPVRDYLNNLEWDKISRVETLLVDYLAAEDNEYVREVTRKTLVAAVARIYQPGIKFDHVLTLVGPQGLGKSRLLSKLGGAWFSDTFGSLQNKDAMEQIQGVWIMEIGELAGLKRQEVEAVKLFIAKQVDRFRVAYGKRVVSYARQCIFIGTTNNREFLQDMTGNRRFWPVEVGIGVDGIKPVKDISQEEVDQIWAEACYMYGMGETLYLDTYMEVEAKKVQEQYTEVDERTGAITQFADMLLPANWYDLSVYEKREFLQDPVNGVFQRDYITVPELWCELLGGTVKDLGKYETKGIRAIMNHLKGWVPELINRKPYGTQRGWMREDGELHKAAKLKQHSQSSLI